MSAQEVRYRLAVETDAEALVDFAARTFCETFAHLYPKADLDAFLAEKYRADIVRAEIADPAIRYDLARLGDAIVGYCKSGGSIDLDIEIKDRAPRELHRLYVDAALKGRGVAHTLMQREMDHARDAGADALWLSVWENNHRAQAFYKRYGFEHMGEHGFWVGKTRDRDFIWRLALR